MPVPTTELNPLSKTSLNQRMSTCELLLWASPVAQLVKNLPAVRETKVQSLGWEDPLEKGKATHSSILSWNIYIYIYIVHEVTNSQHDRVTFTSLYFGLRPVKWNLLESMSQLWLTVQ